MQHGDAAGIAPEIGNRVATARDDPTAVHLKGNQARVGEPHQFVKGNDAGDWSELHGVIVIAELHAPSLYLAAPSIEAIGVPAKVIQCEGLDLGAKRVVLQTRRVFDAGK